MQFSLKHIILLLFALINCVAKSQVVGTKVFFVSEDASSSKILSLIKHSKGYLIAGTTTGLLRFDGSDFKPYKFSPAIKNKAISSITEVNNDTVWIGFQTGEIGVLKNNIVE